MTGIKLNQQYAAWIVGLAVTAVFASLLFGLTGFRTIVAIPLLFIVPTLLLLRTTALDAEEKVFFSLFIGLGLFPLLVWTLNQALPSFRMSIAAAFVIIVTAGLLLPRISGKWQEKQQ